MNKYKFKSENMKNIKTGFLNKIERDAEYRADTPRRRAIRRSSAVAIAAAAIVLSTTLCVLAAGVDPIAAWACVKKKTK